MALRLGSPGVFDPVRARVEAGSARPRTPCCIGSSRERCAGATPLPGSARPAWLALLAAVAAVAGCKPYVEGNCVYGEENRTVSAAYQGVRIRDGIEATVSWG